MQETFAGPTPSAPAPTPAPLLPSMVIYKEGDDEYETAYQLFLTKVVYEEEDTPSLRAMFAKRHLKDPEYAHNVLVNHSPTYNGWLKANDIVHALEDPLNKKHRRTLRKLATWCLSPAVFSKWFHEPFCNCDVLEHIGFGLTSPCWTDDTGLFYQDTRRYKDNPKDLLAYKIAVRHQLRRFMALSTCGGYCINGKQSLMGEHPVYTAHVAGANPVPPPTFVQLISVVDVECAVVPRSLWVITTPLPTDIPSSDTWFHRALLVQLIAKCGKSLAQDKPICDRCAFLVDGVWYDAAPHQVLLQLKQMGVDLKRFFVDDDYCLMWRLTGTALHQGWLKAFATFLRLFLPVDGVSPIDELLPLLTSFTYLDPTVELPYWWEHDPYSQAVKRGLIQGMCFLCYSYEKKTLKVLSHLCIYKQRVK